MVKITKIVNFISPWAGVIMPGRGHISHYSKYAWSSTLSTYIKLIAIVLRDYNAAFLRHCFFFIYDGAVDMQIRAFLERIRYSVFDTEVTVKAWWPCYNALWKIMHFDKIFQSALKLGPSQRTLKKKWVFFSKCVNMGHINALWKKNRKSFFHDWLYFSF